MELIVEDTLNSFEMGTEVWHPTHGPGKISEIEKSNDRGRPYLVNFCNGESHRYNQLGARAKLFPMMAEQGADNMTHEYVPRKVGAHGFTHAELQAFNDKIASLGRREIESILINDWERPEVPDFPNLTGVCTFYSLLLIVIYL